MYEGYIVLEGIDWDVQVSYEQYLEKTINTRIRPWYLKGLDKLKLLSKQMNYLSLTMNGLKWTRVVYGIQWMIYFRDCL